MTSEKAQQQRVEIGFSACHSFEDFDRDYMLNLIRGLEAYPYDYFEWFRHAPDVWIRYPVLDKLNRYMPYQPEQLAVLREGFAELKAQGKKVGLWLRDIFAPPNLLELYPELKTPRGDLNLSHPLLEEFLRAKVDRFIAAIPEMDTIVLTMIETTFPVLTRFDNRVSPAEAMAWLIGIYADACRRHGKDLVVRSFTFSLEEDEMVRGILTQRFPQVAVMLKSDPGDWHPFLPLNPLMTAYGDHPKVLEMDLAGEYVGRGYLPAVQLSYIRERVDYGLKWGVRRIVGRVDRNGRSALTTPSRLNIAFFSAYLAGREADPHTALVRAMPTAYPAVADREAMARIFERAYENVVKHLFYTDGHLLMHGFFGDLHSIINNLSFEILRPGQDLAHCRYEWCILENKRTLSAAEARDEKDRALAEARTLLAEARTLAAGHPDLVACFENLVWMTEMFQILVAAIQQYQQKVYAPGEGTIRSETDRWRALAEVMERNRGPTWQANKRGQGLPAVVRAAADQMDEAFEMERRLYREIRGRDPSVEDLILCGFPNEDHRCHKHSHGAPPVFADGRWMRSVPQYLEYTSSVGPGAKRVAVDLKGFGAFSINGRVVQEFNEPEWRTFEFPCAAADGMLIFRVEKRGAPDPVIRQILVRRPR